MLETDKKKIAAIMEKHGVIVGYIFGSAVRGQMGPHSDIDTAVLFDRGLSDKEQFDKKLSISHEITHEFSVRDADVINLSQTTNPVLRYEAVLEGEPVFVKTAAARVRLLHSIMLEYEDNLHLRETMYRILRDHLK